MNLNCRAIASLLAAGLACLTMGGSCGFIPFVESNTVSVDFLNDTDFDVNAFVNGSLVDVVPAHSHPPATLLICSAGATFQIDGDFLAQEGDIPAVNSLVFDEGSSFSCGDTLQVDFFVDGNGNFTLDGQAVAP